MNYEVKSIDYQDCKEWLLYKHYAKKIPSISYAFGLYKENILVGVMTIGKPASYTLCEGILGKEYKDMVYELNRLVVLDGLEKNSLSFFVSSSLKIIPTCMCIVSYADNNQGHNGYIYQATNWIYTGLSSVEKIYYMENGEVIYTRRHIEKKGKILKTEKQLPKHRYVYFLGNKKEVRLMRQLLKYTICPYPKGENKRYDASYQPTTQIKLL